MSDRPAPPAQPPAPPRTPAPDRPPQAPPSGRAPQEAPAPAPGPVSGPPPVQNQLSAQGPATRPVQLPRTAAASETGDTAVRVGLADRVQAKLASATQSVTDRTGRSGRSAGSDGAANGATRTPTAAAPAARPRSRGPRRARLRLTRIDPWSVMKTAFLLSIAFGIVTVVAVAMIWQVIDAAGVWTSLNDAINEVVTEPGNPAFDIRDYVGTDRVLGFAMLVAAVDVVLITAIATLTAFLYNMSAALLGGIEVTLAEDN